MSAIVNPKNIFVVVPAFNEADIITSVINQLQERQYSVIVVDDGSIPSLEPAISKIPVHYLRHKVNLGQGAAIQTGIDYALSQKADYIVTFDADGQHDANDIEKLLKILLEKKLDIVLGSRFIEEQRQQIPFRRRFLLQFARYVNFLFTGLFLTDAHNGMRLMTRAAARQIHLSENRMAHATEILSLIRKKRLRFAEAPVHIYYTDYSRKKGQGLWSSFRILFDILLNKIFG